MFTELTICFAQQKNGRALLCWRSTRIWICEKFVRRDRRMRPLVIKPKMGNVASSYMFGLAPSSFQGPCHLLHSSSRFGRRTVSRSLGGEICSFSEFVYHMGLVFLNFFGRFCDRPPAFVGVGGCGSLFPHLLNKIVAQEKYPARHFRAKSPTAFASLSLPHV